MEIYETSEQRMMIKFLVKFGKNSQEINERLNTVNGDSVFKRHLFLSGLNLLVGAVKTAMIMQDQDAL